jgi:hypothetical protein
MTRIILFAWDGVIIGASSSTPPKLMVFPLPTVWSTVLLSVTVVPVFETTVCCLAIDPWVVLFPTYCPAATAAGTEAKLRSWSAMSWCSPW